MDLRRVLLINAAQILNNLRMFILHRLNFFAPLLTLFVLLLFQQLTLLLNALFIELKHLNFIVNVATFDIAQLKSVLDFMNTLTTIRLSFKLLHFILFPLLVLLIYDYLLFRLLLVDSGVIFIT